MSFMLPTQTQVNKYVAKEKFYKNAAVNTKVKDEFIQYIKWITRTHKLSENTLWIKKTETISEIQLFTIELKQKNIPNKALAIIDKAIQYPILFTCKFNDYLKYWITYEKDGSKHWYRSERNEDISFNFEWYTLQEVYKWLVKALIDHKPESPLAFQELIDTDRSIKVLETDIQTIENKIKREKQFNRKVELNQDLIKKKDQLAKLKQ